MQALQEFVVLTEIEIGVYVELLIFTCGSSLRASSDSETACVSMPPKR